MLPPLLLLQVATAHACSCRPSCLLNTPPCQAVKYVESHLAIPTSSLGADTLMAAARTAMSSKIVGADSDFFGRIVVDAVTAVKSVDEDTGR